MLLSHSRDTIKLCIEFDGGSVPCRFAPILRYILDLINKFHSCEIKHILMEDNYVTGSDIILSIWNLIPNNKRLLMESDAAIYLYVRK